jgi:hypothetical protein
MDKKDIYEHLARIYLDTPAVKKKKSKVPAKDHTSFLIIGIAIVLGFSLLITARMYLYRPLKHEYSFVLAPDPIRIPFAFNPGSKQVFDFDLNGSNLSRYSALEFTAKRSNYDDFVALRVEFTNRFKERSEYYVKDLPSRWHKVRIRLDEFKGVSDWNEMQSLSFVIEEWNTRDARGSVYIDNVRFVR